MSQQNRKRTIWFRCRHVFVRRSSGLLVPGGAGGGWLATSVSALYLVEVNSIGYVGL